MILTSHNHDQPRGRGDVCLCTKQVDPWAWGKQGSSSAGGVTGRSSEVWKSDAIRENWIRPDGRGLPFRRIWSPQYPESGREEDREEEGEGGREREGTAAYPDVH